MGTPTQVCVWSCPNFSAPAGRPFRTARMVVRVPPVMSSGLSASIAEVAVMSESALWPSLRKRYREDEGPTAKDEDPYAEDEGLTAGVESPGMDDEGYGLDDEGHGRDDESRGIDDEGHSVESDGLGLEEEEAILGGQQQTTLVMGTTVSTPLRLGYGALRHRELALEESNVYSTFEVGQGFGLAPVFERHERGGLISDHAVRLEELSPALFERSLEYEQERVAVTFRAIWRPGENRDLRLQLAEERRARLELAKVVDGRRRGQEPRGGA
ncbi:hypothetical protein Tco_1013634 [Tanacetum coccineum]